MRPLLFRQRIPLLNQGVDNAGDSGRVDGAVGPTCQYPVDWTTFVEDSELHVERNRIDVSRVDCKDMDNLMPKSPLELEDVLDDLEQLDAPQRDAEFLRELASQRRLGRFTELDTATDQSMEVLPP